ADAADADEMDRADVLGQFQCAMSAHVGSPLVSPGPSAGTAGAAAWRLSPGTRPSTRSASSFSARPSPNLAAAAAALDSSPLPYHSRVINDPRCPGVKSSCSTSQPQPDRQ